MESSPKHNNSNHVHNNDYEQKQKQKHQVSHSCNAKTTCPNYFECLPFYKKKKKQDSIQNSPNQDGDIIIVYVLGGPGSGKGTQCSKIVQHFGFTHLSAGELLQSQVNRGSPTGEMIQQFKKEGKLVPSELVVNLLQQAMQQSGNKRFLIDGFPRNQENRLAAEQMLGIKPNVVLVFDCSEEEMISRVLQRKQINAERPPEEVFRSVEAVFSELGLVKHGA